MCIALFGRGRKRSCSRRSGNWGKRPSHIRVATPLSDLRQHGVKSYDLDGLVALATRVLVSKNNWCEMGPSQECVAGTFGVNCKLGRNEVLAIWQGRAGARQSAESV